MTSTKLAVLAAVALTITTNTAAQQVTVVDRLGTALAMRVPGPAVAIQRGLGTVSRLSSLALEWYVVNDSSLKLVLDGPVGARGWYDDPWFRYNVDVRVMAFESVAAFEVRVLTFNIWREFTGTLSFTQLEDFRPGQRKNFDRVWGIYGESQLREHFTSIAYVARVRFADGRTVLADPELVLRTARTIQASVTAQDLQPKPEPLPTLQRRT